MKTLIGTALLVLGAMSGPVAAEGPIDLADYLPGRLAATHDLRAADGRVYRFAGDVANGLWSRSIDPGCTDYQVWAPEGLYYLGWVCPDEVHWMVPPERLLPRMWNPATPWVLAVQYVMGNRTAVGDTLTHGTTTITAQTTVEQGEALIHLRGDAVPPSRGVEHWWVSSCIPVHGGGCAPGIRGYAIVQAGIIVTSGEFLEWAPRLIDSTR